MYCKKRRRRREKEQDNNTSNNDGRITRQKQTPVPAGESSSVLTVTAGQKDNSSIGNIEDDEDFSMNFETVDIKVEKLDDEDVEPFCVGGDHDLVDVVGGRQICDDDDGDNSEIHNNDDEFLVTLSGKWCNTTDVIIHIYTCGLC